jgi:peptidylprolyl isomerase
MKSITLAFVVIFGLTLLTRVNAEERPSDSQNDAFQPGQCVELTDEHGVTKTDINTNNTGGSEYCLLESRLEPNQNIDKEIQRFSRQEGYMMAEELKKNIGWVDLSSVVLGVQDYIAGKRPDDVIKQEGESDFYRITYELLMQESQANLQYASSFLKDRAASPYVHLLEGGKIIYEVIAEGDPGSIVQRGSSPLLHYVISTLNGLQVVNTRNYGEPCRVPLEEAIPGFARGVEGMHLGERRTIYIHPDFGYGEIGQVPPNSLLIVEVEVMSL